MDILASFSLLCDIPGFMDAITPGNGDNSNRHVTLDRAAKAAQAGARSARIMQVIALAQLLRYKAQRMKMASKFTLTEDGIVSNSSTGEDEGADGKPKGMNAKPQTRVGEKLTEMTMRKVILGVLLMLLVLPVFDANVYYGHPTFLEDGGLVMLHDLYGEEGNSTTFQNQVQVGCWGVLGGTVTQKSFILPSCQRVPR